MPRMNTVMVCGDDNADLLSIDKDLKTILDEFPVVAKKMKDVA